MFCKYCGANLNEHVNFCSSCGKKLIEVNKSKTSNVGKGKAISSMVLGIVAIVWAFFVALALVEIPSYMESLNLETLALSDYISAILGTFLGINLLSVPTGITGLVLGLYSEYKGSMKTSGIVMCSLSLFIALISLLVMLFSVI